MMRDKVFKELENTHNLPTLPAVLQRLTEVINDPNADAARVEAVIKDDPAMVARILRVAHSAAYGSQNRIESIKHAVSFMGFKTVSDIALMTSVFSSFDGNKDSNFNLEAFWRHSVCTGIAAYVLYEQVRGKIATPISRETLQLCGLLHDIGKILFESFFHQDFQTALQIAQQERIPLWTAERQVFGTDHAEVGAWLAERWQLAPEISAVIKAHHEPESVEDPLLDLLRLCHTANHICNIEKLGDSGDATASGFHVGVWKRLGLRVRHIREIVQKVNEAADQSETLMAFVKS